MTGASSPDLISHRILTNIRRMTLKMLMIKLVLILHLRYSTDPEAKL